MQTNANVESIAQLKRRLNRFTKTASVMDLRSDEETRKARAERFERRNKTSGKRAVFA
jgi:hypothetical protein